MSTMDVAQDLSVWVFGPNTLSLHVNWCVTIYSDDPQLYQAHLVHQFKRSCEEIESEFSFVCCHDKKFTKNGIEVLQEFLSLKSEEDIKLRKAYVYEQNFPVHL